MKNPSEWTDLELIVNTLKLVRSLQDVEPAIATTTENWAGHEITFEATLESVTFGPKTLEQIDSALDVAIRMDGILADADYVPYSRDKSYEQIAKHGQYVTSDLPLLSGLNWRPGFYICGDDGEPQWVPQ